MVGSKTGITTRINYIESHAHLTHCQGHALQLVVGYTIRAIKMMRGTLDPGFEFNKLIKYSMV